MSTNSELTTLRIDIDSLRRDTKTRLSWYELSRWYSRKKLFLWSMTAEQGGVKQEEHWGFTWYFRIAMKASNPSITQEETSVTQFLTKRLKNFTPKGRHEENQEMRPNHFVINKMIYWWKKKINEYLFFLNFTWNFSVWFWNSSGCWRQKRYIYLIKICLKTRKM